MKTMKYTLLAGLALSSMGWAQDADPFASKGRGGDPDPFGTGRPPLVAVAPGAEGLTLTFELFSVPMAKVAEMKRGRMSGKKLYEALIEEVKLGKATQDQLLEVRTVDGQTVSVEQVKEYIYPTEYEPPELGTLPKELPAGFKDFEKFITPAMPSAFDTRNLGVTMEVTLDRDEKHAGAIFGRVSFSHVSLEDMVEWGEKESKVGMPKFSMQRINSAVSLWVNEPQMLGTLADPSEKAEKKGHVWVAFATVFEEEVAKKDTGK
jgi:hypothetical protein